MVKKQSTPTADIVSVQWLGSEFALDLNKQCPKELFSELSVPGKAKQKYIPAPLVREIMRVRQVQVTREVLFEPVLGNTSAILRAEATVVVDDMVFCGSGLDVISLKKLAVSAMGQGGHVVALALKGALKKRFKFFEGDFETADEYTAIDDIDMEELTQEVGKVVGPTPVVEEVPVVVEEIPVTEEPTLVVEETVVAPVVVEETAPKEESPVAFDEPAAPTTGSTPEEKLLFLLEKSKAEGSNTINKLVAIGQAVMAEMSIVKGSAEHTKLLDFAKSKMEWFTSN